MGPRDLLRHFSQRSPKLPTVQDAIFENFDLVGYALPTSQQPAARFEFRC